MKRKLVVVSLVVVGLGVLVVQAISQPAPSPPTGPVPTPSAPPISTAATPPASFVPDSKPNFSAVQPPQPEWTFEQLVEALKGVRARQKDLQIQEADLLAKMAKKVDEKRDDLSKSEATLHQLRSENGRVYPAKHIGETKLMDKAKG